MDILSFEAHEYEVDGVDGFETDPDLEDRLGFIEANDEGAELVLTRSKRQGTRGPTEMLRFHRVNKVLRIFPKITRGGQLEDQFDRVPELQIEAPRWDPEAHSVEDDRYGLMQVRGLPIVWDSRSSMSTASASSATTATWLTRSRKRRPVPSSASSLRGERT